MSIRDWFRSLATNAPTSQGDTETVRRIVSELDKLDPARARYLAAFAYVLTRVAGADHLVSEAETARMVDLVRSVGRLPDEQATLIVEIAKSQNRLLGGTENFLVTREFRSIASDDERRQLLDWLFAVSAADGAITGDEEAQVWQIASELGFEHGEYIKARFAYSDKRSVLRSRGTKQRGET
jgi:uncharacterized tellurite resistance protein B-like protein